MSQGNRRRVFPKLLDRHDLLHAVACILKVMERSSRTVIESSDQNRRFSLEQSSFLWHGSALSPQHFTAFFCSRPIERSISSSTSAMGMILPSPVVAPATPTGFGAGPSNCLITISCSYLVNLNADKRTSRADTTMEIMSSPGCRHRRCCD